MKGFGLLMIAIGLFCMAAPALSKLWDETPAVFSALEIHDKEGNSITLYPLLGIVAFAAGGAMITAAYITKKPKRR
jgi:uncharacterized membrane protein HdeD (DUF308 family)